MSVFDETALADLIREIVREEVGREDRGDDWIDQAHSPLGRKMHLRLVRLGELPGARVRRRVLVRRRDLDAYIEAHRPPAPPTRPMTEEDILLARVGARRIR